jgi:hypothetical protein
MGKEYHLIKGKGWGEMDQDPPEEEPVELRVRDADTFEERHFRAILSRTRDGSSEEDQLWFYGRAGHLPEERPDNPWRIEVLEEFSDHEEIEIQVKPNQVSLGRRGGGILRSMLEDRQKKSKEDP